MDKRIWKGLGIAVLSLGLSSSAGASFGEARSLANVSEKSEALVHGTIVDVRSQLRPGPLGGVWTFYTLDVLSVVAGEFNGSKLTFRCMGGQLGGGKFMKVEGHPTLHAGDEVVFFYQREGLCQIRGGETGVFWMRSSADGQRRLVDYRARAVASFSPKGPIPSKELVPRPGPQRDPEYSNTGAEQADLPPPGDGETVLDELNAFALTVIKQPRTIVPTTGFDDAPLLSEDAVAEPPSDEVQR